MRDGIGILRVLKLGSTLNPSEVMRVPGTEAR